jgi:hypothetical protein
LRDAFELLEPHNARMTLTTNPFTLVPLLATMRDLNAMPRDMARFKAYLETMVGDAQRTADVKIPPLVAMNPMAKPHVLARINEWIALEAETVVAQALEDAALGLGRNLTPVNVGLVLADDAGGGWTNRTFGDYGFRFGVDTMRRTGWLSLGLWSSDPPSLEGLRADALMLAARYAFVLEHGAPVTLRAMMEQEGFAAAFAGKTSSLEPDDLEYTRAVLEPLLQSAHQPTNIAALYGDDAARELGYPPLGLSTHAGFELALAQAQ